MGARFTVLMSLASWFLCGLSVIGALLGPPQMSGPFLIAAVVLLAIAYEHKMNRKMDRLSPNPRRRLFRR